MTANRMWRIDFDCALAKLQLTLNDEHAILPEETWMTTILSQSGEKRHVLRWDIVEWSEETGIPIQVKYYDLVVDPKNTVALTAMKFETFSNFLMFKLRFQG